MIVAGASAYAAAHRLADDSDDIARVGALFMGTWRTYAGARRGRHLSDAGGIADSSPAPTHTSRRAAE